LQKPKGLFVLSVAKTQGAFEKYVFFEHQNTRAVG